MQCLAGAVLFGLMLLITFSPSPAATEYGGIRTVAVASVIGHIPMRVTGLQWQWGSDARVPGDWAIDDFVTTLVANALRYRFTVMRLPSTPASAITFPSDRRVSPVAWLREHFRGNPSEQKVDAYVVVFPITVHSADAEWQGLALTHKRHLFDPNRTFASAAYAIGVYDAQTGDRIGYGTASVTDSGVSSPGVLVETCDNRIWANRPEDLTPKQRLQINDEFRALIAGSLSAALERAHLIADDRKRPRASIWEGRPLGCRPN